VSPENRTEDEAESYTDRNHCEDDDVVKVTLSHELSRTNAAKEASVSPKDVTVGKPNHRAVEHRDEKDGEDQSVSPHGLS
jgi:hypothetical protein